MQQFRHSNDDEYEEDEAIEVEEHRYTCNTFAIGKYHSENVGGHGDLDDGYDSDNDDDSDDVDVMMMMMMTRMMMMMMMIMMIMVMSIRMMRHRGGGAWIHMQQFYHRNDDEYEDNEAIEVEERRHTCNTFTIGKGHGQCPPVNRNSVPNLVQRLHSMSSRRACTETYARQASVA